MPWVPGPPAVGAGAAMGAVGGAAMVATCGGHVAIGERDEHGVVLEPLEPCRKALSWKPVSARRR